MSLLAGAGRGVPQEQEGQPLQLGQQVALDAAGQVRGHGRLCGGPGARCAWCAPLPWAPRGGAAASARSLRALHRPPQRKAARSRSVEGAQQARRPGHLKATLVPAAPCGMRRAGVPRAAPVALVAGAVPRLQGAGGRARRGARPRVQRDGPQVPQHRRLHAQLPDARVSSSLRAAAAAERSRAGGATTRCARCAGVHRAGCQRR